jgi:carbamoylphosphate synthase large subunit
MWSWKVPRLFAFEVPRRGRPCRCSESVGEAMAIGRNYSTARCRRPCVWKTEAEGWE